MSTTGNPLSIFSTALETAPKPFSLSQETAEYNLRQQQAAEAASRVPVNQQIAQGQQIENQRQQQQLQDEQAIRDTLQKHSQQVPVGPPSASLPPPAMGPDGKPMITPPYQAAQWQSAPKVTDLDEGAAMIDLMKSGRGTAALTLAKTMGELQKQRLANNKEALADFEAERSARADVLSGPFNAMYPDGPDKPRSEAGVQQALQMAADLTPEEKQKAGIPPDIPLTADVLDRKYRQAAGMKAVVDAIDAHLSQTEKKTQIGLQAAQTTEAAARAEKETAEAADLKRKQQLRDQFLSEFLGSTGGAQPPIAQVAGLNSGVSGQAAAQTALGRAISREIDPNKNKTEWQEAYGSAQNALAEGDVDKMFENVHRIADRIANNNLTLQREKEASKFRMTENMALQNQMTGGDDPTVKDIPIHLRPKAIAAAQKAGTDYAGAVNAANEMQDIVNLMRSGNKVAYAYSPVTGVLTVNSGNGIKRVNMAEIHSYGAAGSDIDRIEGWFGKHVTGESIAPDIVDSMEQFHQSLGDNAEKTYRNNLTVVNKTYPGAKFSPITLERTPSSKAGGKVYSQADVDAAVKATPGLTAAQADAAFQAKGWDKQ